MKMDIVESDLKQLFMWTKLQDDGINSLQELCKSQQVLIEQHQDAIETLEERIIEIEKSVGYAKIQEDNK